jgi:hypothetical protein
MNRPYSLNYARLVPPVAGELFTKPSFCGLFTRSSAFIIGRFAKNLELKKKMKGISLGERFISPKK